MLAAVMCAIKYMLHVFCLFFKIFIIVCVSSLSLKPCTIKRWLAYH